MLVSKESHKNIEERHKRYFQKSKRRSFYAFIETTLEQEQIDDLCREPCIGPQIQTIKHRRLILATTKEILLK